MTCGTGFGGSRLLLDVMDKNGKTVEAAAEANKNGFLISSTAPMES